MVFWQGEQEEPQNRDVSKEGMMNDRTQYATLINKVFGIEMATFEHDTSANAVIGALEKPNGFAEFHNNFGQRLCRLAASLRGNVSLREGILSPINKIATTEWAGAYAELCALDYFLADSSIRQGNIALDSTVCADQTLASEMGMKFANHDIRLTGLGVSMDTKLLSDKVDRILEGIFEDFRSANNIRHLTILPSYNHDEDFAIYQSNRQKLLNELQQCVHITTRTSSLTSSVIPGLSYTFAWEPGVLIGISSFCYRTYAKKNHHLLFGYAKKFSRVEPTVIVLVHFPWAGDKLPNFEQSRRLSIKQLGDHFFSDYVSSSALARDFNKKIKSQISAGDLSRHLSGILFLEDDTILAKNPNDVNVKASYLWNPNALHPLANHRLETWLKSRGAFDLQTLKLSGSHC